MASVMSAIQTQLVTDIQTTSITVCNVGAAQNQQGYPHAELYWLGGEVTDYLTGVQDRDADFQLIVYAKTSEEAELAIEELIQLWRSSAKLAVLRALDVMMLHVDIVNTGPYFAGSITQQPIMAEIEFRMVVRY